MIPPRIGYLLADDLMFTSKITGTARAQGLELSACRTPADLLRRAGEKPPACVLLDLHMNGLVIEKLLAELKKTGHPFVVGYGSHVQADVLRQARAAGCDLVLPRSQFVAELEGSLSTWFGSEPPA
jgi:CheY-like chemotaxis protein